MKKTTKLISILLSLMLAVSSFAGAAVFPAAAEENEKQLIYFQYPDESVWTHSGLKINARAGVANVYCYAYAIYGNSKPYSTGWKTRPSMCKVVAQDGKALIDSTLFSFDLAGVVKTVDGVKTPLGPIEEGADYGVVFSTAADGQNQTCDLTMSTECIGDTVIVTPYNGEATRENAADSMKVDHYAAWKNTEGYGPKAVITSLGMCTPGLFPKHQPKAQILSEKLKIYLTNPINNTYFRYENNMELCKALGVTPEEVYNQYVEDYSEYFIGKPERAYNIPCPFYRYEYENDQNQLVEGKLAAPEYVKEVLGITDDEPTTEPETEPVVEPTTEPETEPVTEPEPEPTVESTTAVNELKVTSTSNFFPGNTQTVLMGNGDTYVTVSYVLQNDYQVDSFQWDLKFDSNVLELINTYSFMPGVNNSIVSYNVEENRIRAAASNAVNPFDFYYGSTFVSATFKALKPGETNVNLNVLVFEETEPEEPTTAEPTEPFTAEPTTAEPTTEPPETEPTTAEPTTEPPTAEPTTAEPTTEPPTAEPTTEPPTTEPPTTEPPTTEPHFHTEVIDKGYPATCTEDGLTDGSHCSVCGEIITAQEVIPAKGHTEVTDKGYPATCTETGLTDGSHCSVCGEILTEQEIIPAAGHKPVIIPAVPATCQHDGHTIGSQCEVCGEVYVKYEIIPKLPHTPVTDEAVAPDCTHTGLTEGSHCSVCGEVLVEQNTVEALGHSYDIVPGTPATHFATGLTDGVKCTRCGEWLIEQQVIPKLEGDVLIGDVNFDGVVDIFDATMIQKYAVDKIALTDEQKEVADVNNDGIVDIFDATDIQKFSVDKITEFKKKA